MSDKKDYREVILQEDYLQQKILKSIFIFTKKYLFRRLLSNLCLFDASPRLLASTYSPRLPIEYRNMNR